MLGYKDLNLFKLFRLVYQQGGCHKVSRSSSARSDGRDERCEGAETFCVFQIESGTIWKQIYMDLGIPVLNSAASYNVKTAYKK